MGNYPKLVIPLVIWDPDSFNFVALPSLHASISWTKMATQVPAIRSASWQLEQQKKKEIMSPSFKNTQYILPTHHLL